MATLRSSVVVQRSASDVWNVVRDAPNVSTWFPGIIESSGDRKKRTVVLAGGSALVEEIVTLDDELRRLQYRAVDGDLPVSSHLGTIDVLELSGDSSIVVYSTEIEPAELADAFHAAIDEAVAALPSYLGS
jgi:uncharacterized membrane protein